MSLGDEKCQADMEVIVHACGGSTFDGKLGLGVRFFSCPSRIRG